MSFETFFGSNIFNLYQMITPYKGSKKFLLYYRIIVFIILCYGLFTSIYVYYNPNPNDTRRVYFAFFTNQTYFGIMIYFASTIYLHLKDNKGLLKSRVNNSFIHTIIHIFYNMMFPLAAIVTVIFCGLMLPNLQTFYYNFIHYSQQAVQHILQSVFLGIDWYLITVPSKPSHFIPTFLVGVLYLIFVQIYHYVYDHWVYKFLNTDNSNWYIIYTGVILFWTLFGLIFSYIQNFKNRHRTHVTDIDINKVDTYNV
ncbi:hypothetical protein BCR32DRAFT_267476 [Anaeromyces robustus]|uniref:FAR-17a/AIG1-like protein n=1 Tax=Anaeromyces robustus TaxID=1754192 RepID=A0A1Y1XA85_9FUNG|nr:hypothetical protein BCR32DRAFT_267476 [Anaeromyces robustus]|eukprot:ORX82691.1 hypothetical protein BCR32DRAFT_267476 [Anaeromyces robustus]